MKRQYLKKRLQYLINLFFNFLKQMHLFSIVSTIILSCVNVVIWKLVQSFIVSIKMTIVFYVYYGFVIIFNLIDKLWRKERTKISKKYYSKK